MTAEISYTAEDVAALAELIRPRIEAGFPVAEAVALAEADSVREIELANHRSGRMFSTLLASLSGTYDEFRAEAGLADGEYAFQRSVASA